MRKSTRVIAYLWLVISLALLIPSILNWQHERFPVFFFLGIALAGSIGLIRHKAWGWWLLGAMSTFLLPFSMCGIMSAPFLQRELVPPDKTLLQTRLLAFMGSIAFLWLCGLTFYFLRSDPPMSWGLEDERTGKQENEVDERTEGRAGEKTDRSKMK
jgi:glucose dehydrogenase